MSDRDQSRAGAAINDEPRPGDLRAAREVDASRAARRSPSAAGALGSVRGVPHSRTMTLHSSPPLGHLGQRDVRELEQDLASSASAVAELASRAARSPRRARGSARRDRRRSLLLFLRRATSCVASVARGLSLLDRLDGRAPIAVEQLGAINERAELRRAFRGDASRRAERRSARAAPSGRASRKISSLGRRRRRGCDSRSSDRERCGKRLRAWPRRCCR